MRSMALLVLIGFMIDSGCVMLQVEGRGFIEMGWASGPRAVEDSITRENLNPSETQS